MASKADKIPERIKGLYSAIPHAVLDSQAFIGLSMRAKALLFDVMRQHSGRNNGHMQLTYTWLKSRGWSSADQIAKSTQELQDRKLIYKTKQGGLNIGPSFYALTWHHITNRVGLDEDCKAHIVGAWRDCDLPQSPKRKAPQKRETPPVVRNSSAPMGGKGNTCNAPMVGSKTAYLDQHPTPPVGNNETLPFHSKKKRRPVVGAKGKSGIPKSMRSDLVVDSVEKTIDITGKKQ